MGYKNWQTPLSFFAPIHADKKFTIDVCGSADDPIRILLPRYYNEAMNGLTQSWKGERVWCNPPYDSTIPLWLAKACEADYAYYLLPPSVDTAWFHEYVIKAQYSFYRGRIRFYRDGKPGDAPRAGNLLVEFGS